MGHTVKVDLVPPIRWKRKECVGIFIPGEMLIQVRKGTKSVTEQTFLHELVHAVLFCMNNSLYENEEFVDTFAGLAHQALTSAKYDPRQPRRSRKA
jgi:hypothetical protein